ncbi:hypothetical protein BYT27DRAFT_7221830 [Phlegmacium glaucopus]|nr:hypothetical protein BYT27DRAFT_7221830 [Phlegmacium glaucopus]
MASGISNLPTIPKPPPVLDAEGYAICPDCGTCIKCGPAGLKNLEKCHCGTDTCKNAQAKQDKEVKKKKNGLILSFLKPRAVLVPLTVSSSSPIHCHKLAPATTKDTSFTISTNPLRKEVNSPGAQPVSESIMEGFIWEMGKLVKSLPLSTPEASEIDKLSVFGADPRRFDDRTIDTDELWENRLHNILKATLGWGKEGNMEEIICQGKWGLDGLLNFVTYFVKERGVSEGLLRGKLDYLIEELKESALPCKGFTPTFPEGKSPHTAYPFALHDTLILPWDYTLKNGVMILFARSCAGLSEDNGQSCQPCRRLIKNKTLEGIFMWIEDGIHKKTGFLYHGFKFYCLCGLNQAKKLLAKARALSDQKQLLMAIVSGKVSRLDRLLSIGLQQKKGLHGLLALYMAAAEGHYNPNTFTEEEDMKLLLLWKLGGNRVAEINHCANKGPSITYLRTHSTVPPIIPSPGQPTVDQVQANIEATFGGLLDVIYSQNHSKFIHTVLMFVELATEKRIRWDPKTNHFLGICREHGHKTSTEFVNEDDMEELFQNLDDGKVHYAGEATVGALGVLSKDNRIYPGRPVLVSGDCKRESGEEHAEIIKTVLEGVNSLQTKTKLHITSIASDASFILLTFKSNLPHNSPIYPLLKPLKFLNLYVGDDDLTCDKDWKHVFKHWRNLLLQQRGVVVNGLCITPDIIWDQFKSSGLSADHICSLFNPEDQQDIKMAFDMLKDIWNLSRASTNSCREQIEHLSATAHLTLILYRLAGKEFIPTNLYIGLMIMIKNAIFSIAKAIIDNPDGEFWLILLGTDQLEELFGILRTMVGNDASLDVLQLVSCLAGMTEVSNILAKYPQWDRSPYSTDHIKPGSWRGNVKLKDISILTSWNCARMVEQECDSLKHILLKLDKLKDVDILSPFGTLLVDVPLVDDDIDESIEVLPVGSAKGTANSDTHKMEICVDVEDKLRAELASSNTEPITTNQKAFDSRILIKGFEKNKARALKDFSKYHKYAGSTDRLKRVQAVPRYIDTKKLFNSSPIYPLGPQVDDSQKIVMSDPIATLVRIENEFWLCLGEINGLRIDGQPSDYVSFEMLVEEVVTVNNWRTYMMDKHSFTVPGRLVHSIDPTTSKTHLSMPFYLLQSTVLVALTASLFQSLTISDLKSVPKLTPTKEYPYCKVSNTCFICESDCNLGHIEVMTMSDCSRCQHILEHVGSHILYDPGVIQSIKPLCVLCLRPSQMCQFYLAKGKGMNGKTRINQKASKGCLIKMNYSYSIAAESSTSSPCSNVPVHCPICPKADPAIWKYFMKVHFKEWHKTLSLTKYEHLWKLSNFEHVEMKKIWAKRSKVTAKCTKKLKILSLVISENHQA